MSSTVQRLVHLIFAYTCIEGLVINIMYPNTLAFIFKDVAIAMAYLLIMTESGGSSGSLSKFATPAGVFAMVMVMFLAVPSPAVSFMGELVAIKQRLFYIPLMYVGYAFTRDDKRLFGLLNLMAWTAIPVAIFGIYLYFAGPSALQALGANYSATIHSTSGAAGIHFWRVPGTFTSPGQFGMYLLTMGVLLTGVLFSSVVAKRQRLVTIVALVLVIGALLVSGSRSPLLVMLGAIAISLTLTGRLTGIGTWATGLYAVMTVGFAYFGAGVQDRVGSIASWEHVARFNATYYGQLFLPLLQQSPMGFGLGIATIGARHFSDWDQMMLMESYFGIIAAETGFIGLLAFLWLFFSVIGSLFKARKIMKGSPRTDIWHALAMFIFATAMLSPVGTALDAAPGNLYFWFFLGVAMRLYDMERARLNPMSTPRSQSLPYAGMYYNN
jgi:hypothetical protein